MENKLDKIYDLLKNGISDNEDRELLAQSLFYYCCGKDPTPIIAFRADYPLYTYSDNVDYVQGDASKTFQDLYSDDTNYCNYIQPKCICNYRYEFFEQKSPEFFNQIEKRTEYILGHCSNNKYKCIAEYDYYGDFGDSKVKLYHRMFWYVY